MIGSVFTYQSLSKDVMHPKVVTILKNILYYPVIYYFSPVIFCLIIYHYSDFWYYGSLLYYGKFITNWKKIRTNDRTFLFIFLLQHSLMNLKINYLLEKLLKWTNKNVRILIFTMLYFLKK